MTSVDTGRLRTELDPEVMLAAATEEAGLDDFGDDAFLLPFRTFLDAAITEAGLNDIGVMAVRADSIRFLVNRLRFTADLLRHPEILDEDVSDPIIVTGLPRTGTSKLQRMLSAAPNVQRLLVWRLLNPAPIPGTAGQQPDPRIAVAQGIEGMLDNFPEFQAAHPTRALEVDEDLLLHEMTFDSVVLTFRFRMPSYLAWVGDRPVQPAYDYAKTLLQYLQWQDGGAKGRPWVLKTPAHISHLDTVLDCFPRATVVHCHRDPVSVIPSFAKAIDASRRIGSDHVDPVELGTEQLSIWSSAARRNLALRDDLSDRVNIVDLPYELIRADPHEAIGQVFRAAGRDYPSEAREQTERWSTENPQHRFGNHRYSLEQYHLTEDRIRSAFGDYLERFGDLAGAPR